MAAWRVRVPTPRIFVILGGLVLCLGAALLITVGGCAPRPAARALLPGESAFGRYIDLTHAFDEQTVYWPTEEGFKLIKGFEGHTEAGYYYAAHRFEAAEHGGTHIDAPIHFYEAGASSSRSHSSGLSGRAWSWMRAIGACGTAITRSNSMI